MWRAIPLLDFAGFALLAVLFLALLTAERLSPLRRRVMTWGRRFWTNVLLAVPAFVVIRLLLIPAVVAVAIFAQRNQIGLVHWLGLGPLAGGVVAFLLLDYTMFLWHWANHRVPFLWRFHNVHHTDLDLDVSTAIRFHFGEMLMSVVVRSAQVLLAGASPLVVILYEIALEASTQFHHSNLRLPYRLERVLSWFIVTPRAHGIHHSIIDRETNSNFSNLLLCWDRLHGTIRLNVRQDEITIGVPTHRDADELTIRELWLMPFRKQRRPRPVPEPEISNRRDRNRLQA
jgi:sterol desaturase/sphingolipid hydroxylase (fatty acid hydroxylase superfamily)